MRAPATLLLALVLAPGCKAGDGLVVVSVMAMPPLANVATLAVTATIGTQSPQFAIPTGATTTISSTPFTFGIDVPARLAGSISVRVDARDGQGLPLASGMAMGSVAAGARLDLPVTLGSQPSPPDLASPSDASAPGDGGMLLSCTGPQGPWPTGDAGTEVGASCGAAGGVQYVEAYRSALTRWCVDPTQWAMHAADYRKFFAYGDFVVGELTTLFAIAPSGPPLTIEAPAPNGGATTGTDFGAGANITGDAFYTSAYGVVGFYGYMFIAHEMFATLQPIGWPNDWWSGTRAPFQEAMDVVVMGAAGVQLNDVVISSAANAQRNRFDVSTSSEYDSEVKMFNDFADQYGGICGLRNAFKFVQGDGITWSGVSANPSPLLTNYVIAYTSLGFGTKSDLTATFTAAGVGTKDTTITAYTPDAQAVGDIADAHCAIAAAPAASQPAALVALRKGDYKTAKVTAPCGPKCPAECGCDSVANQCVAAWRAR
jgi:hypothetical protein